MIEVWRLLKTTVDMVLQGADDGAWQGRRLPGSPSAG